MVKKYRVMKALAHSPITWEKCDAAVLLGCLHTEKCMKSPVSTFRKHKSRSFVKPLAHATVEPFTATDIIISSLNA